jgi:hypothetical protein
VLAIVPPDDHEVIAAVQAWPAEVDFESKVGRLCDLSSISNKYHYNARRVKHAVLTTLFADEQWQKDVDIIMRPTDAHGTTPNPRLPLSCSGCLRSHILRQFPFHPRSFIFRLGVPCVPPTKPVNRIDSLRAHRRRGCAVDTECVRYHECETGVLHCREKEA